MRDKAQVVWDWHSTIKKVVADRRGEPTTIVWAKDLPAFLGGTSRERGRLLRRLRASGLLIARPESFQTFVKLGEGKFVAAYVFACAPEDVPRIEIERSVADTGRTAGRLMKVGSW